MILTFRAAGDDDLPVILDLKRRVMRDELVRVIGSFSEERSAERVRAHYSPRATRMIVVDGEEVGTITLRLDPDDSDVVWLEMFYLEPAVHGRGVGTAVLTRVLAEFTAYRVRLEVLSGARVRGLYERHGFVEVSTDGIDDVLERAVSGSETRSTR